MEKNLLLQILWDPEDTEDQGIFKEQQPLHQGGVGQILFF